MASSTLYDAAVRVRHRRAAGIGKTALAVHWAHRVAWFPDGQLFVNLRGHYANGSPFTAGEALLQLLYGLGAAPADIAGADKSSVQVRRLTVGGGQIRLAPAVRWRVPR